MSKNRKLNQHLETHPKALSLPNFNNKVNWQWYEPPENKLPVTFCLESSMHGLKYVGKQKLHACERLLWITAFMASAITAIVLICEMCNSFIKTPTVTVFHPLDKNIDEIPFPGITICNLNRLQKSSFQNHKEKVQNWMPSLQNSSKLSREQLVDLAMILDMSYICDSTASFTDKLQWDTPILSDHHSIQNLIEKHKAQIEQFADPKSTLKKVAQPCKEMILRCIWHEEVTNCEEIFHEIETDFGKCCTFNTLPKSLLLKQKLDAEMSPNFLKEWQDAEIDYENILFEKENINRIVPFRQKYPGRTAGLSILLNPDLNEYFCSNMDSQGFIMGVHVPIDYPRMNQRGLGISTNSEILVPIQPEITVSDNTIAGFPVKKRECYFGNEYKLPNFSTYTFSNCILECSLRESLKSCNCVKYNMPQSNKTNTCKPNMYSCLQSVRRNILNNGISRSCSECLPTCTEISYRHEVTQLKLDNNRLNTIVPGKLLGTNVQTDECKNLTIVHVYFNEDSAHPKLRKEMTTITQLISNAGGLLGLCVGFSMLSLLEVLYYVSLRLYCSYNRDKILQNDDDNRSTAKLDISGFYSSGALTHQPKQHLKCVKKIFIPAFSDRVFANNDPNCLPS